MSQQIYKHNDPGRYVLFFVQFGDDWYYYTAAWYNEEYPWSDKWQCLTNSIVDTTQMCVISAGIKLKLELSSPLEFLILTGKELQKSIEVERVEPITKI